MTIHDKIQSVSKKTEVLYARVDEKTGKQVRAIAEAESRTVSSLLAHFIQLCLPSRKKAGK